VLRSTDLFALHAPFRNMPEIAMKRLLGRHLGLGEEAARELLERRGLCESVEGVSRVGNIYSASLYLSLAFLLAGRYREWGPSIAGRRLLLASYGSGNTMLVLSATVAAGAPEVIARWDLARLLAEERVEPIETYLNWLASPAPPAEYPARIRSLGACVPPGAFYLAGIREDGYREYAVR
jgi:hydroxymethylglutaryl-CoA synthase